MKYIEIKNKFILSESVRENVSYLVGEKNIFTSLNKEVFSTVDYLSEFIKLVSAMKKKKNIKNIKSFRLKKI